MIGRMGIDDISPIVSAGLYPAKAVVGELIPVSTAAWREGHDAIGVTLHIDGPGRKRRRDIAMRPSIEPDVFNGAFVTLMPAFHLGATYILQRQFDAGSTV